MYLHENQIKKGNQYSYKDIEEFAENNNYSPTEHGTNIIGENFIVLNHNDKDITVSFVLVGTGGDYYIYECIYSDLKN